MRSKQATFTETARRAQIIRCAIETIADLGFHQASLRKIADRAGLANSAVLYHFGSKDELVKAVLDELYRELLDVMVPAVRAETTAWGKLTAHIRVHLGYIITHRAEQIAMVSIGNDYRGPEGARFDELAPDSSHVAFAEEIGLEAILASGVASGEFRELRPRSLAVVIRGAIGSAMMESISDRDEFDVHVYADDLIEALRLATVKGS